jgi:hypothetical protein
MTGRSNSQTATLDPVKRVEEYLQASALIPGWLRGEGAEAMASVAFSLPENCVIVEIGSFLGSASVLLAGARKVRGSGRVHCVDPFDASGDSYSVPIYSELLSKYGERSLRQCFDDNIRGAGLSDCVEVHQGKAQEVAKNWIQPVDLLFLDGDQSPTGARLEYESWKPFLKLGGMIALHNSAAREYAENHNGHRLLAVQELRAPKYSEVRLVGATHFARKVA